MMLYLRLFFEFFKTGLFAVGGGMATLPFMYDISDRTGWFTHAQLADMIAVSESTPGPIGVNMATYVGFATGGVPGAIVATLGVITPSVIVILIVARILKSFRENVYVDSAFYGLRPCSMAMIASAGLLVAKQAFINTDALSSFSSLGDVSALFSFKPLFFAALLWILMTKYKKHPIFYILLAGVIGIVFQM